LKLLFLTDDHSDFAVM